MTPSEKGNNTHLTKQGDRTGWGGSFLFVYFLNNNNSSEQT